MLSIRERLLSIAGAEKQGFWLCHNNIYLIPPLRLSSILTPSPLSLAAEKSFSLFIFQAGGVSACLCFVDDIPQLIKMYRLQRAEEIAAANNTQ